MIENRKEIRAGRSLPEQHQDEPVLGVMQTIAKNEFLPPSFRSGVTVVTDWL
jgi:hypothetical protein